MRSGLYGKRLLSGGYHYLRIRTAAVLLFALTWWGILYPELCFTDNTYEQIIVVDGEEIVLEETDYRELLQASGDEIVLRSRLLEWLAEKFHQR